MASGGGRFLRSRDGSTVALLIGLCVGLIAGVTGRRRPSAPGSTVLASVASVAVDTGRDALTGLLNRRGFEPEASARPGSWGLLLLDLDGFKSINDLHGHDVGDRLLAEVAERLCAEANGVVARYGGDEFVVLVEASDESELAVLAEQLRVRLGLVRLQGFQPGVGVRASVGWALHRPGDELHVVFREADMRLYVAKAERSVTWYGDLATLVADVLERAPESELLDAVAGALAQFAAADAVVLVAGGSSVSAPDLASTDLVEIAFRAAMGRLEPGARSVWEAEESTVATALLGERHAPAGAFACVRQRAGFTKRERLAIAHAGRLLGSSLAARNALIGERTRAEELLACSHCDETTGIPNRRALLAWLDELDPTVSLAVLLADFDGLRSVNNELGPDRGDELIRHVATAIQRSTRPGELAARLHGSGGDEFVVCCPHHDAGQATARATQLEHQLGAVPLPNDLARLYQGASVGTSIRRSGEDPMAFLERAAGSMRERKGIRKAAVS